nr:ABC transporter ATP-binding protein [uncultured Acetatifactor sp.]
MVELRNVSKAYKNNILFTNLNLTVPRGDICGILGENGSGKSVLLKMICGFALPDAGEVLVGGERIEKGRFPRDIGVILDSTGFLPGETGLDNLLLLASIRGKADRAQVEEAMRLVGLKPELEVPVGKYSQGMKQRLAIAQALMEKPSLLVLDEPLNAIDIKSVAYFRQLFRELNEKEGVTIILTSHYSQDIQELCRHTYDIHLLRVGL